MITERIRYRVLPPEVGSGKPRRVRVYRHLGHEGYWARWTEGCSGCAFEDGTHGGCHECGYTGKRRVEWFVPFDHQAFEAHVEQRWKRRERLLEVFRQRRMAS